MPGMMPFIDLAAQQARIASGVEAALKRVLAHGQYIMGPEVAELETTLSRHCGAAHTLSCSNGTDAIVLVLRAKNIGPGDAVFVPSFTFAATAEAVALVGAVPVFVDVLPDTMNMDPASLREAIVAKRAAKPKAIIAVDIFGLPADYDAISAIARESGLFLIADAAQSYGASIGSRKAGTFAPITTTSFFPAKPLGCYGDGGAIFTNDNELAATLKSLRVHGQGQDRYDNVRIGLNGRLDTMQAAVLLQKMTIFDDEIVKRQIVAKRYRDALHNIVGMQDIPDGHKSVWAQFTVTIDPARRERVITALKDKGIPAMIYYPIPLHRQKAYSHYPTAPRGLPATEKLCQSVLSLPMHPYLDENAQARIIETFTAAVQ